MMRESVENLKRSSCTRLGTGFCLVAILVGLVIVNTLYASPPPVNQIQISSADSDGNPGNTHSGYGLAISGDGRFSAFNSYSTNLIPSITTPYLQVFFKDNETGAITMVSTDSSGSPGNSHTFWHPSISANGRFVTFISTASNLVPNTILYCDNGHSSCGQAYIKDTMTGAITMVSTDANGSQGDSYNYMPMISAEGRFVAFYSYAGNLMPDIANGFLAVFVKDTQTGLVTRASTNSAGEQANDHSSSGGPMGPALSADGRYVAFPCDATNLVQGDTNGKTDVFLKDTHTGITTRVSTSSEGSEADGRSSQTSISGNGRYVVFSSAAGNLVSGHELKCEGFNETPIHCIDIYLKDTQTGITEQVSTDLNGEQGNGFCSNPSISGDGRFVTFQSDADNLVPGDTNQVTDVFVKDVLTGFITIVSTDSAGNPGNASSSFTDTGPAISSNGRYIAFPSFATNLVPEGSNGRGQIYRALNPTTDYYLSWYDNLYGSTWMMMAQPPDYNPNRFYNFLDNSSLGQGIDVSAGSTVFNRYDGQMDGPMLTVAARGPALITERSLFGDSLEEIWATPYDELDSHYYWPYYFGALMNVWLMVANPLENGEAVQVDLTIQTTGGPITESRILEAGANWTPIFPGQPGTAVEVDAYRVGGDPDVGDDARKVIASQRSLFGEAFNEMPGIAASGLSDHYMWTWYDSIYSASYIGVGNPGSQPVWATVYIGGELKGTPEEISPGHVATWSSGAARYMNGPVEVIGCANDSVPCDSPADIYASEVSFFGPSYGEIAGTAVSDLMPTANWTWYDMRSPASFNWIVVANPTDSPIYFELTMPGMDTANDSRAHGILNPGERITPTFPGFMGGPVQVSAWTDDTKTTPAIVFASQRVLWGGYFNEVVGKGL